MTKFRHIKHNSLKNNDKNFFVVDAGFLANKYIPVKNIPEKYKLQIPRINSCKQWWKIIENQLDNKKAMVYIPDICVAEVIKVFSKKYYQEKFLTYKQYKSCVKRFIKDLRIPHKKLASKNRHIKYHDISTSRDILISVERFNRNFNSNGYHKVSVPDLIIVATAKYLMDFYNIPYKFLHILTTDKDLKSGSNKIREIPSAYDPASQNASSIFK